MKNLGFITHCVSRISYPVEHQNIDPRVTRRNRQQELWKDTFKNRNLFDFDVIEYLVLNGFD